MTAADEISDAQRPHQDMAEQVEFDVFPPPTHDLMLVTASDPLPVSASVALHKRRRGSASCLFRLYITISSKAETHTLGVNGTKSTASR